MNEELRYRSHTINLELTEIRPQRFRWLYVIDATHLRRSSDGLRPMHTARIDALAQAFGEIDAMETATTTPPAGHVPCATMRVRSQQPPPEVASGRSEASRRLVARRSLQAERAGASLDCDATRSGKPRVVA